MKHVCTAQAGKFTPALLYQGVEAQGTIMSLGVLPDLLEKSALDL